MKPNSLTYPDKELFADAIREIAYPLDKPEHLDPLLEKIGSAHLVLLGEASHGTHEYYLWRAQLSKRLIEEKGFNFIAVEGDWPDCYWLNRYVKGLSNSGNSAHEVLQNFNRWPTWMWANWEIAALLEWMRQYNAGKMMNQKVGFYGLDVYSLWESMDELKKYLQEKDPATYQLVENAMQCFAPYSTDEGQSYARASFLKPISCEDEVVQLLREIRRKMPLYNTDPEAVFSAEQNALVMANAEKYYHVMIRGGAQSWNIRDNHMFDTLERLMRFHGPEAKAIVWEHNTHIGDARYTDMRREGMYNVGELARKEYGRKDCFLLGFGSYQGEVTAAHRWAAGMQQIKLPPAIPGSWENALHSTGEEEMLLFSEHLSMLYPLEGPIKHRAVGVVYNPESERLSNYVPSIIPDRYDAFIYLDKTSGLHPLHIMPDGGQTPETYPWGV